VQNTCGLGNRIRGKANSREPKSQDRTPDRSRGQSQEGSVQEP
jgi:hypothetical protein